MKQLVFIIIILILSGYFFNISQLNAQGVYSISGVVLDDTDKSPLPGANISLWSRRTNELITGTSTDTQGKFIIKNVSQGGYRVEISYVGYITDTFRIRIKDADVTLNAVSLKQDAELLNTYEITTTQTRLEIKGDTVEHKADAYKMNPDATAEDLVKKLPGVTTEGNTVKVDGEEVKKILVDGKPYFTDDPSATLKNLPADIVDNIQMFDFMSEQSQFTGFRDGNEEKAINLNTKKGTNVGSFGKAYAGYGPDNKYNAGLTFNKFNSSRRFSILGMSNNVNQQNFSQADIMSVMSNSTGSSGRSRGRGQRGGSTFQIGQQDGLTKTDAFGLNYNDIWGNKFRVSGSYFFNRTNSTDSSSLYRNYFTGDGLIYEESNISQSENINHRINAKIEYLIDTVNKITLTPRLIIQDNNRSSTEKGINTITAEDLFLSQTENNNVSKNLGYNFANDLLYQHKFQKKGRTLSFNLNTLANNRNGEGSLYTSSLFNDTASTDSVVDRNFLSGSKDYTIEGNLTYTEPISDNMRLLISYKPTYRSISSDKTTSSVDSAGFYTITDTLLSNIYDNTYSSHKGGIGYGLNTSKTILTVSVDAEQANLRGIQRFPGELEVNKDFFSILPSAYLSYKVSRSFNISSHYRSSTRIPDVSQLQNVADVSNPLFIKTGNPYLKQSKDNRLTIRVSKRMPEKERHFMLFASGTHTSDYITNATYFVNSDTTLLGLPVSKGSQLNIPVNLDDYINFRTFGVYGLPIAFIKSNLNLNTGYTYTQTPGLINGILNYSHTNALNGGLNLSSNISKSLDFSLVYNGSYNIVKNTINTVSDNNYFSHTATLKAHATLFSSIVLNTDISHTFYNGLAEQYEQQYTLWNAYVGYKVPKVQTLELRFSVNDILNQNTNISRSVTETYTEDSRSLVLRRYALFTLTYTFRHFKNATSAPEDIKPPKGMPPPGTLPPPNRE